MFSVVPEVTVNADEPLLALVMASASRPEPIKLTELMPPSTVRLAVPAAPITFENTALAAVVGLLLIVVPLSVTAALLFEARTSIDEPAVVSMVVPGWVVMEASSPAAGVQVCDTL